MAKKIVKSNEIYNIEVTDCNKRTFKLEELKGKVLIIVNIASNCGLAKRSYLELSSLLVSYRHRGLRVLLFPCRQFLKQEFEEMEEIKKFIKDYSDDFMLMDMVNVIGNDIHPLFRYLKDNLQGFITNDIKWNFTYFLIGRNGELLRRYGPTERVKDTDKELVKAINAGEEEEIEERRVDKIEVEFNNSDSDY